ncbi:MAG: methyltransferase domain-containing protein [Tolypothrix carrinoi HA7290-LM1]|jgi:predicted SAM-dependent methyltransferase|nr:methyltransferase domain-containing protein [Tolypothrix carrinoi HA7290-LM1]
MKQLVKRLLYKLIPLQTYVNYHHRIINRFWQEQLIPQYAYLNSQYEISAALIKAKSKKLSQKYENAKDLLVNVGAGPHAKADWINVDISEAPGINCVCDCRKSLPFPDNSVKGIFTEHFFEHIDYVEEVPLFLSECYRVLKPGGIIRIIVPDIEKYLYAYCQGGWEELSIIRPLDSDLTDFHFKFKYNTRMELINFVFRQQYEHKYAYDYETLEFILYKYGFSKVQRQAFGKSLMDELSIDQQIRASESLYVEAIK